MSSMMRSVSKVGLCATNRVQPKRCVVARAADKEPTQGTVFYAGESFSEEEWKKAVASNRFLSAEAALQSGNAQPAQAVAVSFGDIMNFAGAAPEVVNGRLAMLGFVAAMGAELASEETVVKQWSEEPTGIAAVFMLIIAASLITVIQRKEGKLSLGPFTPSAELLNGRAAMLGFAALLIAEGVKGSALF